ncbi:hypothetical protein LCGC14_2263180 [marine sediment metagenome]|uniref:Homeodomain phBC6A51-type domain-containing protein n=1 Tax=marine sediment metagenome TaxID=412755 RepID=A0A0F9CZ35_9ZZZZ
MAKKLAPKQERAAQLIAAGISQISTANHPDVDVSKQTMNRWCHEESFQERVDVLVSEAGQDTKDILEGGQKKAAKVIVDTIDGNMDPESKIAKLRFDAAKYVLDMLKVKKLPAATKPSRQANRRNLTDAEMDEMMEPLDSDE